LRASSRLASPFPFGSTCRDSCSARTSFRLSSPETFASWLRMTVGLDASRKTDLIVVAMPDAVLVADRHRVPEGKQAVALPTQGRDLSPRSPPPGLGRDAGAGRPLSGQADRRAPRRGAEPAEPLPAVRALDRGFGTGEGDCVWPCQHDDRKPVGPRVRPGPFTGWKTPARGRRS
jgi:hypothetical protein